MIKKLRKAVKRKLTLIRSMTTTQGSDDILVSESDNSLKGGEIIDTLLQEKTNLKNQKQLMYLSGAIQSGTDKIRFTLEPKFGFLFTFNKDGVNHYCWELLQSHASYIWTINNGGCEL